MYNNEIRIANTTKIIIFIYAIIDEPICRVQKHVQSITILSNAIFYGSIFMVSCYYTIYNSGSSSGCVYK